MPVLKPLQIYHVLRPGACTWQHYYRSCIVVAEGEAEARRTLPSVDTDYVVLNDGCIAEFDPITNRFEPLEADAAYWVRNVNDLTIIYLGIAAEGIEAGVILADYIGG